MTIIINIADPKLLKMARALAAGDRKKRRWGPALTSEQKRVARHAAQAGLTLAEIANQINWTYPTAYLSKRLRENHIHFGRRYRSGMTRP
jgi:hypothetical protein